VRPALPVVVIVLAAVAGGEPTPAPPPPGSAPVRPASPSQVPPAPADFDLDAIRDIFRFGTDAESGRPRGTVAPGRLQVAPSAPPPAPAARLVGLVRHPDGLRAALALEGEVVLLGRDDSALGYTVVDVSEERVVVRDPGGEELTLEVGPGFSAR
jgi:hypothetical protein